MIKRKNPIQRAVFSALENLEQRRMLSASVKIQVIDTPFEGETLQVTGTTGKDQISVYDDPQGQQFFVWVDKNHNGTATGSEITNIQQSDYDEEINTVLVDSDKGDDTVNYYLVSSYGTGDFVGTSANPAAVVVDGIGTHRSIEIDLAAGNDTFSFSSPTEFLDDEIAKDIPVDSFGADITNGSDVNLEVEAQEGNDVANINLGRTTVVESEVRINADMAAGNDTVNFTTPDFTQGEEIGQLGIMTAGEQEPPIEGFGPTILQLQVDLGSGNNTMNSDLSCNVDTDASLLINVNGGSGKDVVNDFANIAVRDGSTVAYNANLGSGDDKFHSEFYWGEGGSRVDRTSQLGYNVQAQDGNDDVKFDDANFDERPIDPAGDFIGNEIQGSVNLQAYGGNGNDSVQIDFSATEGSPPVNVSGGYFRGLVSGDYGNDKVRLDVEIGGESFGTYDFSVLGGGGDDTLGVRWNNPNDEWGIMPGEYGPGGGILVDGGRNNDKYDTEFDELGISPFIVRACEKLVESLEAAITVI